MRLSYGFGVSLGVLLTTAGCGLTAASDEELLGGDNPDASFVLDAGWDGEPPEGAVWPCQPNEKRCDGVCVDMQQPEFGCDKVDCTPCPVLPHTTVGCANFECTIGGCEEGWGDCNADEPGCETLLRTNENCGECGTVCDVGSGAGDCSTGTCRVVNCLTGWGDCDTDAENGCETNLATITDCGACGTPCTVNPPDVPSCSKGYCDKVCDPNNPLVEDCDGDPTNGCETDLDTLANCGGCGTACSRPHAIATCAGGTCRIAQCESGWGDCDGIDENGCGTSLASNVNHCGSCGSECSNDHVTGRTCTNGQCRPTCENLWDDCNGPEAGDTDDGCETPLDTVENCGDCGSLCSLAHASETCNGGVCQITSCASPWEDCNNTAGDGCERDLDSDITNCGQCFLVCSSSGGTPSCSSGNCGISCDTGREDCDANVVTGCETNIDSDVDNCGGCGDACSNTHIDRTCLTGQCVGVCQAPWADCNGNKRGDGCELNISANVFHCGSCSAPCSAVNVLAPLCSGGVCLPTCVSGWSDCNPAPGNADDGCEFAGICP